MKMTWKSILVVFILLFILFGCSESEENFASDQETAFLANLMTTDVNQSLQLVVEGDNKSFPFGSEINLVVNNLSSSSIALDTTMPVKLLRIQDNEWVEVENEITYSGEEILAPKGTLLFDTGGYPIQPAIKSGAEIVLRAVVIGEFIKDDIRTGDLVAAYIDIRLSP